jgi:hypothetical protein
MSSVLSTNTTAAENASGFMHAFQADGFALNASAKANENGNNYVAWNWKRGAIPGFDIVTGTQQSGGAAFVSTTLMGTPDFVIAKDRTTSGGWYVTHTGLTGGVSGSNYLILNSTSAQIGGGGVISGGTDGSVYSKTFLTNSAIPA